MTYGNKIATFVFLFSFLFIVGCQNNYKNFHYDLYDGYSIKGIDKTIKLYKNNELVNIENSNYKITDFKYNSDVVCLKLSNGKYYMIYYVDTSIYGPYTKETLDETINNDSTMSFTNNFQNILKADVIYE